MAHTPLDGLLTHATLMGVAADGEPAFHCGLGLRRPAEAHRMEATAARLVAAWNACAGIPTAELTPGSVKRDRDALAGIPEAARRPGIVKDLIAACRLACGVAPVGGSGTYKYVDAQPLRSLLRELGSE